MWLSRFLRLPPENKLLLDPVRLDGQTNLDPQSRHGIVRSQCAVMEMDGALRYGQTKPDATGIGTSRLIGAKERFKDLPERFDRHARTVIADGDGYLTTFLSYLYVDRTQFR